ncbi:MAG TPA: molybdenum cofactor biosynthesis protein MoaE [Polyangia bacterium]|nr:molybdenum cofactor biosynthesis protein MoaE [Polyangia bacterium]
MTITVLYFAMLRERARRERETVTLAPGSDVAAARAEIARLHPELAALLPRVQAAVNRAMAADAHALAEGDELALIPPVAGGSGSPPVPGGSGDGRPARIAIGPRALALDDVVAAVAGAGERGGVVTFAGVVRRDGHAIRDVVRLEYEAYAEMALEVLTAIADELERELPGARVAIHHRVGALAVGETAVVIAAAAPHRAEAFTACRAAIDRLKERAPIWKKEIGESGEEWLGLGP